MAGSYTLFTLLLLLAGVGCQGSTTKKPMFEEYKDLVPESVYEKLVRIYSNKTLLVIDKLKELDDIFMTLPTTTLSKLPTPRAFRKLPEEVQQNIRRIYYSKRTPFEEKLRKLEEIIHSLPHDQLKMIPIQHELPGLVEFDVPVLLQFNGHMETHLLRNYLSDDDFEVLVRLIAKHNIPEVTRARLVGQLLKEAYNKKPEGFPLPLGEDDPEIPDEISKLGIHLLFSRNPFENISPFQSALKIIRKAGSSRTLAKNAEDELEVLNEAFSDDVESAPTSTTDVTGAIDEQEFENAKSNRDTRLWDGIGLFVRRFRGNIHSSPALWFRAEEACITLGGHLASIRGSLVNSFVAHIAKQPCASEYWLGGGWNTEVSNGWSWTDGTPFKYTAWARGEPSTSSTPICLAVNSQTTDWYSRSCYDSKPYVCKVPARFSDPTPADPTPLPCTECQTPTTCPEPPTCPSVPSVITTACPRIPTTLSTVAATTASTKLPTTCPVNWTYSEITKKCYQIKRGIQESNYTAIVELCRSLSAQLPSLHSQQENAWLTDYLFVTNSGYWAYKLGLFRENAGSPWQWADGSQVDYANWAIAPDSYGNECVDNTAIGTDGQWYNTKEFCVPYDSAVCQKDPQ